ncbi:sensor histidine kinase [Paenibacillus sp. 598K]|uniref:sensor histidine kinase n=1 Tax=Paenibacillus sp. 598K TaxID=1117987 RepID=UPI0016272029|nr:sensor histidine kinase [Paenibacillus sp. 598K]
MASRMYGVVIMLLVMGLAIAVAAPLATAAIAAAEGQQALDAAQEQLRADQGVLDLRSAEHGQGSDMAPLDGEWEFYRGKLLEPGDPQLGGADRRMIKVPASWSAASDHGLLETGHGHGTYRLLLRIPPDEVGTSRGLFIRSIGSAYRIWIDGAEYAGLGTVGADDRDESPQSHINLIYFQPGQEQVELLLQVSNYSFREGGIRREMLYGSIEALTPFIVKELLYDIFIIGGFLFIGVYHLVICAIRKRDPATLFLGLVTVAVAARTLLLNGYLSKLLLGIDSWELLVKLEYVAELTAFILLVLLMKHLYPREAHRTMLYLSYLTAGGLGLYVLTQPADTFTSTLLPQTAIKAAILLYFVFYVGIRAMLRQREGARINLVALLVLTVAIVNDTFYYMGWANTVETTNYAVVLFLLAQTVIVAYRYSLLSARNDALVGELAEVNLGLEEKVRARTEDLRSKNEQLAESKSIRTKMLVHIAHDLASPVVGIRRYVQLMAEGKQGTGHPSMMAKLAAQLAYIERLIQDLFELSKLESGELPFHLERVAADALLAEIRRRFEPELEQENYVLHMNIELNGEDGQATVTVDRFRILQALQNYVGNAVKFSRGISEKLTINGRIRRDANGRPALVIEVEDYGRGIPAAELPQVFLRFYKNREGNEQGSGLGLTIVQEIARRHGGDVGVSSGEDGSVFYLALPLDTP